MKKKKNQNTVLFVTKLFLNFSTSMLRFPWQVNLDYYILCASVHEARSFY